MSSISPTRTVSLQQIRTYDLDPLRQAVQDLLDPLGGMPAFFPSGIDHPRVLLKPNLLTGSRPQSECTTRPELVQVVAEAVLAAGGRPVIGDSPAFGSAYGVAEKNGLLPVCEALGIPIVEFHGHDYALNGEAFAGVSDLAHAHLRLSREAMQADVVINLPKVKSHMQLGLTLAVKNLFGCVPGKLKAWWHMDSGKDPQRFATMLVETALAIAPQLTVVDGIIGHEGNGPSGGSPRPLGILAAAADVFAVERILIALLNVDPEWLPVYQAACQLGVMPDLDSLEIVGAHWPDLVVKDWRLPDTLMPIDFGVPRLVRSTVKHVLTLMSESRKTLESRGTLPRFR